jgi:hypothetical protein
MFSVAADDVRHSRALRNGVFRIVSPRGLDAFVPGKVGSSAVGDITYFISLKAAMLKLGCFDCSCTV